MPISGAGFRSGSTRPTLHLLPLAFYIAPLHATSLHFEYLQVLMRNCAMNFLSGLGEEVGYSKSCNKRPDHHMVGTHRGRVEAFLK